MTTGQDDGLPPSEDDLEMEAVLAGTIARLRRMALQNKKHIQAYEKTRRLHEEILKSMVQYYERGKYLFHPPTPEPVEFDLETRVGAQAFYDLLIYPHAPGVGCLTEEFLHGGRYRKAEKIQLLEAMLLSRVGLFEVARTDFDEGRVTLKNVFTAERHELTDIGLSGSPDPKKFFLYARILRVGDVAFNAGANLIFDRADLFIRRHIRQHRAAYRPEEELSRFLELYRQYSQNPDPIRLVPGR